MEYFIFGVKSTVICAIGCAIAGGIIYSLYLADALGYWFMWAGIPISFGTGVALIAWIADENF